MSALGNLLHKARESKGLSLQEAADIIGSTKGHLHALESVPLPPVVTVVYHVHDRTGAHIGSRTNYAEAAERASPWEGSYIVKHTITNGVPSVEVVK